MQLPEKVRKTLASLDGGESWLKNLPERIRECERLWSMRISGPLLPELSYNVILPAELEDGTEAILKIRVPHKEFFTEMTALRAYGGKGIVRLIDSDHDLCATLLERLSPGRMLSELVLDQKDDAATRIAGPVIRDLHAPVPKGIDLPTVADWCCEFDETRCLKDRPITDAMLDRAQSLFAELDGSKECDRLIHGDLHHYNILYDERRGWTAIDPKGLIGDPVFDTARMMHNPGHGFWERNDPRTIFARRSDILSEILEVDRNRILGWSYVDTILSWCWSLDDPDPSGNVTRGLGMAEAIYSLMD